MPTQIATAQQFFVCENPPTFANPRAATHEEIIEAAMRLTLDRVSEKSLQITGPDVMTEFLALHYAKQEREVFSCLFLDGDHRLIAIEDLFFGTINSAVVSYREVLKRSLFHNAAAVVAAHNHPSGRAKPSGRDIYLTSRLSEILDLIDVRLLDHVVVGARKVWGIEANWSLDKAKWLGHESTPRRCKTCGVKLTPPRRGRRVFCSAECRKGDGRFSCFSERLLCLLRTKDVDEKSDQIAMIVQKCGVARTTANRWLTGASTPATIERILPLVELGVEPGWLIDGQSRSAPKK